MKDDNKSNVLLIVPQGSAIWSGEIALPPSGIAYVSSYLKTQGINVYTLNLQILERQSENLETLICRAIKKHEIDIVGTGGLVNQFAQVKAIMDVVKANYPNVTTFMGNGLVTYSPQEAMRGIANADVGIIGEGEITSYELIRAWQEGKDLSNVNGIVYRQDGEIAYTAPRSTIDDLDTLPFPDWEGFQWFDGYYEPASSGVSKTIPAPVVTSRGCPFSCTYCTKSGGGKKYRQRSLDNIFEEIDYLVMKKGVNLIFLDDELFAVNPERIHEFCKRIEKYHVHWIACLRVGKHMTDKVLACMKEAGCVTILYGFESGSDTVLRSMHKGITTHDIYETVTKTSNAGIFCRGNFIFGDVAENLTTINETFQFIRKISSPMVGISCGQIYLYPGSHLYDFAIGKKYILDTLGFIKNGCPPINISGLTDQEYNDFFDVRLKEEVHRLDEKILSRRKDVAIESADRFHKQYLVSSKCDYCGSELHFPVYATGLGHLQSTICYHCGRRNAYMLADYYAKYVNIALEKLLSANKCAVWGYGAFLERFYLASDALQRFEWIQVDGGKRLWGKVLNDRTMESPQAIQKCHCDTVIISAPTYSDTIADIIKDEYPLVKKIIKLHELGMETIST